MAVINVRSSSRSSSYKERVFHENIQLDERVRALIVVRDGVFVDSSTLCLISAYFSYKTP